MKKIHLINIGCKVNFAETSRLKEMFHEKGYEIAAKACDSDVVLINTCTVTNKADADCRSEIRKARRASPEAYIGVFGCYAQLNSDELSKMPEVNAVFGMKEKFLIPEIIDEYFAENRNIVRVSDLSDMHFDHAFSADAETRARAFLKIQDGCDYVCTYCTIPKARGASRGIDFNELSENLKELYNRDYREVVLTGINLGEYKSPQGHSFEDVLLLVDENDFGFRLRVSSIEPNLITSKAIDLICNSKHICPHFHIPLQSGSDNVLNQMKRRYNTAKFKQVIEEIVKTNPNTCIGIDVICGFPGETDEFFEDSFDFISNLPISYLHVFTYSERKGTPAASMPDVVPNIKRKERTARLRKLSEQKYDEFCNSQIGKTGKFLPETFNQLKGLSIGHTENYVKCSVKCEEKLENQEIIVKHIEYKSGMMSSELID